MKIYQWDVSRHFHYLMHMRYLVWDIMPISDILVIAYGNAEDLLKLVQNCNGTAPNIRLVQ